jgi:hypothetical protein
MAFKLGHVIYPEFLASLLIIREVGHLTIPPQHPIWRTSQPDYSTPPDDTTQYLRQGHKESKSNKTIDFLSA